MKHSEVLSRYVNTGGRIPEEQYDRLTPSLKKSYLRRRGVDGNYFEWEFKIISDDERINYIKREGIHLNGYFIDNLIKYSGNRNNIIISVIDGMGEYLNNLITSSLLRYSEDSDDISTKIIEKKGGHLSDSLISLLLKCSVDRDDIATKIIKTKGEELNYISIEYILKDFENVNDHIAIKIIETLGEKLISEDIESLLNFSDNVNDTVTMKIIETKGEKLEENDIVNLFQFSLNKELIKKTLLQNGVDYDLINLVIGLNNFPVKKIPDNYQSMLNEIKRIKEIMK